MDFASLLLPALAVGATALTGGAAAPALAAAGEAGAAGAAATGTALGTEAMGGLAGQLAADSAAGASGLTGLAGGATAAPGGYASILEPLGGMSQGLGSGLTGAADPAIAAGSLGGAPASALPMGMTSAPGLPTGVQPLGTGLSGTGMMAEIPGTGLAAAPTVAKPGLTVDQMIKLGKMMGDQTQEQQQRAPAAPSGGASPQNKAPQMKALETPGVSARPSLAQLLYGRR